MLTESFTRFTAMTLTSTDVAVSATIGATCPTLSTSRYVGTDMAVAVSIVVQQLTCVETLLLFIILIHVYVKLSVSLVLLLFRDHVAVRRQLSLLFGNGGERPMTTRHRLLVRGGAREAGVGLVAPRQRQREALMVVDDHHMWGVLLVAAAVTRCLVLSRPVMVRPVMVRVRHLRHGVEVDMAER